MADKILVVEDELSLQETLAYNLKHQGYEVETVGDGLSALDAARRIRPDLVLLDVMLPGIDGFEVCRILRQEMNTPVLILTARDDEIDRVVGLEIGADDYMTKPFSMRELLARVKARLRLVRLIREEMGSGAGPAPASQVLVFDNLAIDLTRREVRLDGDPSSSQAQGIRTAGFPSPTYGPGAIPGADPGKSLGLGLYRRQPHGRRPHPLAA